MKKLSLILPCYQEAENIKILIPRTIKVLDELKVEFEIILVDTTEPTDNLKDIAAGFKNTLYVSRFPTNHYGNAVRTGIGISTGDYIMFMDADTSSSPEFIPQMVALADEADVVIASRYVKGGENGTKAIERILSLTLNLIYRVIFNTKCKDISHSFKLYKGDMLRSIKMISLNFDIIQEIIVKLSRKYKDMKIIEIPYQFGPRLFGQTKRKYIQFIISYLATILKLLKER